MPVERGAESGPKGPLAATLAPRSTDGTARRETRGNDPRPTIRICRAESPAVAEEVALQFPVRSPSAT